MRVIIATAMLAGAPALAQQPTAESVLNDFRQQTSVAAISARTSCATSAAKRDPNVILVCGRRETSRYRYGQRGQPYQAKYKGMTHQQVANALAGIQPYQSTAGERAYNAFQALTRDQAMHLGTSAGLAQITDPLNLGFGATRKSRDIYWGIQQDAE